MARHPRIVIPGLAHLVLQGGHNGQAVVHDARDAQQWQAMVREVAATQRVLLHGWHVSPTWYALLATPHEAAALARLVQDMGRRYVAWFNARHGRLGTLWDGRFRSAVVQPGHWERLALVWLERSVPEQPGLSTRAHHLGQGDVHGVADPKSYWTLGNTPFERQARWQLQLDGGLSDAQSVALQRALRSGRPLGEDGWRTQLQPLTPVPLQLRPRGRPRKPATRAAVLTR
jgi:putative transposase